MFGKIILGLIFVVCTVSATPEFYTNRGNVEEIIHRVVRSVDNDVANADDARFIMDPIGPFMPIFTIPIVVDIVNEILRSVRGRSLETEDLTNVLNELLISMIVKIKNSFNDMIEGLPKLMQDVIYELLDKLRKHAVMIHECAKKTSSTMPTFEPSTPKPMQVST